jgi:hypothetical protein
MLAAYGVIPERDPDSARRAHARFLAELDKTFREQTPRKIDQRSNFSGWFSGFYRVKEYLTNPSLRRSVLVVMTVFIVLSVYLFGGIGITAYAASSSLPGDVLYPWKTTTEEIRAGWTADAALKASLYLDFAGKRLEEMQALMSEGRSSDMDQAAREYERVLQKPLRALETVARDEPGKAAALGQASSAILQDHHRTFLSMLNGASDEARSGILSAIHSSASVVTALDEKAGDDDEDGNFSGRGGDDDCLTHSPGSQDDDDCESPQGAVTPTVTPTPQPSATPSNNNSNNDSGGNNSGGDDDDDDDGDGDNDDDGDDNDD